MANKGILSKNYYIDPVAVSDFGADVYNVMAEADRAMEEASEIIAEIASLTERVPSEIRCGALLEACATAQAEIKSVDFLSYGQRVDQGLQNLLDHNQYITDHFIKNMRANTERMHGLEEEFRRLSDLITYSGEGVQAKGIKLFTDGNLETANIDSEEENLPNQGNEEETELDMTGWGGMFPRAGAASVLDAPIERTPMMYVDDEGIGSSDDILKYFMWCDKGIQTAIKLLDTQICNKLGITDIEERRKIIQTILDEKPHVLNNLYVLNIYSGADYQRLLFITLFDIEQKNRFLTEKGLMFLFELELGDREGWENNENIQLDEDGNIFAIKIHDAGDGGYTLGPGIFISDEDTDRIELANTLGIDWDNLNEWVSIEDVNKMYSFIAQEYHGYPKYVEERTETIFTPEQYDAIFSLLYWKPFLDDTVVELIQTNARQEVWNEHLKEALCAKYGNDVFETYPGWIPRIERTVDLYFEGEY